MKVLYAITDGAAPLPRLVGIDDAPVLELAVGDLRVLVSERPGADLDPDADDLRAHADVVAAAAEIRATLPARFGSVLAEAQLRRLVADNADALHQRLQVVRGHAELAVRVLADDPQAGRPPTSLSGIEYMRALAAVERIQDEDRAAGERAADLLRHALAGIASRAVHRVRPRPNTLVAVSFLVPTGRLDEAREAVPVAVEGNPTTVTGPWPPYSFAEVGGDRG